MGPRRGTAAARRRRRQLRLARTIVVTLVLVIGIVVVVSRQKGKGSSVANRTTLPSTTSTTAAPPPPSRLQVVLATSLPQRLSRASAVSTANTVLILGGLTSAGSVRSVLRFDPVAGSIQQVGTLAASTHDAAAAQIGDSIFLFGGGEAQTIDDVQAFGTTRSALVGHLPQARSDLVAASIGGRAYLLGGFDGQSYLADVLETTDGVTFRTIARLPTAVRYPAVATIGSIIYLFGGQSAAKSQTNLIQAVDVAAGTAQVIAQLPEPMVEATAFVLRGAVFLAGGRSGSVTRSSIDRVDLASGALTPVGTLPNPVADAASAFVGDTLYLFGGESPGRLMGVLAVSPA